MINAPPDTVVDPQETVADLQRRLDESLAQQAATAEVMRLINASRGELAPIFDAILDKAMHLCGAGFGGLWVVEGGMARAAATRNLPQAYVDFLTRDALPQAEAFGRGLQDQPAVHIADLAATESFRRRAPVTVASVELGGIRTYLAVPLREGNALAGVLSLYRKEVRPFSDRQIALVQGFAAQAEIAMKNARLFNETREALERQTATSEILRVISQSPTDVQPVFDAVVGTAVRLLRCDICFVLLRSGETFSPMAGAGPDGPLPDLGPRNLPIDADVNFPSRVLLGKAMLHLPDWSKIDLPEHERQMQSIIGANASLFLPLLHQDECIGLLALASKRANAFSEADIAVAESFRDQALIAIQNTRMFDEVQARTRELAASLDELRTAQDRLVQTEKLASLGQLTAGIAHEIKNPLNFVNNFAALSAELTGELNDVLKSVALTDAKRQDIDELTGMLKGNLEKVVQHGQRADSIVKNMLLHSRECSGELRLADINALVEESLNLAYHGARAEKPEFNITLQRDFDPLAAEVDVFPQEITRVFLNLIANGFYATAKRKAEAGEGFEPVLRASTRNLGGKVEIRIRDNGTGIPAEVKEKMFNPFFTTKPAGEGTGLGLSMSHDIVVKQHGGSIDVDTAPGQFTEFVITLPRAAVARAGGTA